METCDNTLLKVDTSREVIAKQKKEIFRLMNIIHNLPGNIYWKDKEGIYLGHNAFSLEQMAAVGLKCQSIVGKTDYDLFPITIADQYRCNDLKVIETGVESVTEETVTLVTGEVLTQLSYKRPLYNENNEIVGIIGNTIDITYLKKIEAELIAARNKAEKANDEKNEIIKHMEHDIRTPFSGIWVLADLLSSKEVDHEKKNILKCIAKSAKELLDYFNNILEFIKINAQIVPIVEKKFNLKKLIEQVVDIEMVASKSKKIELLFECSNKIPEVIISDPARIQRLLLNLTSNAIKFTENGYVKLSTKFIKQIDQKHLIMCLIVEDTGLGLSAEEQTFIYEKFKHTQYNGVGLGLPLVKLIIRELEGELDVKSEKRQGTKFICTLKVRIPLSVSEDYLNE